VPVAPVMLLGMIRHAVGFDPAANEADLQTLRELL
jgi:hypothetical protein